MLQLHVMVTSSCVVVVPTSLTFCKASLATKVLHLSCLHRKYIARVVTNSEIIAAKSRNTSTMKMLEKNFLGKFLSVLSFLSSKSKISVLHLYW